jgi:hypothetical protein
MTSRSIRRFVVCAAAALLLAAPVAPALAQTAAPRPLLSKDHPVDWWFAFKFNAKTAPDTTAGGRTCAFGGEAQKYKAFSQEFAFAASDDKGVNAGKGLLGTSTDDPLGATFGAVYGGAYHYVVWNDQFYDDPAIAGCTQSCAGPWGHSKGMVAWNDAGEGVVLQVTTPAWPGAGSLTHPRKTDGNTLGCVKDNDVLVSQHFFALRLTHKDLMAVLTALVNASVVTNPADPQVVSNGGPADVQTIVKMLGQKSQSQSVLTTKLSTGVTLISKPSALHVPPWQMVSATLGGVPIRAATWWATPKIPTTAAGPPPCWSAALGKPEAVQIATTGHWNGKPIGLQGGPGPDNNHAKIGVSLDPARPYVIFGDLNQQGALADKCASSQNGRGGLFYVIQDADLATGVGALIAGDTSW